MVNIPDEAVQAALEYYSEGGCMGLDSYERKEVATAMLEAALPYLQSGVSTNPVDVAAVRRQALEEAIKECADIADRHNSFSVYDEILALIPAEPAQKD